MTQVSSILADKVILVTGGTGSFGNAMVRRALNSDAREIRIYSRDEKKQEDMRHALADSRVRFYIGDVRELSGLRDALRGVDLVFQAAALKQVPSCEFYPMEAVRTNVLGAENVLTASIANGVRQVVVLSTDKAVYPINAMGMSKALMEKLAISKSRVLSNDETRICVTRYGNVMASRGSVIPLFIQQIKAGRRITVTDPNMTRFLMSLGESIDLVLHAFANGNQGDTFVQKAPACTIGDLAEALQIIFDKRISIETIGTRHGEKLHETLVSREEMARADDEDRYYRIPADTRDLNYSKFVTKGETEVSALDDFTSHNGRRLGLDELIGVLTQLDYVRDELASSNIVSDGV